MKLNLNIDNSKYYLVRISDLHHTILVTKKAGKYECGTIRFAHAKFGYLSHSSGTILDSFECSLEHKEGIEQLENAILEETNKN